MHVGTDGKGTLLLDHGTTGHVHDLHNDVGGLLADYDTVFAERELSIGNACSGRDGLGIDYSDRCALALRERNDFKETAPIADTTLASMLSSGMIEETS